MGKPIIDILDAVHCKANKHARPLIKDCLSYKATKWKRGEHGSREQQVVEQFLITGRDGTGGTFLTGLLPRIKMFCRRNGIKIKIRGELEYLNPQAAPTLDGIQFRKDQNRALKRVLHRQRGKIIFPTGSGKTIIALGIMSIFPECRILWLCHTKDLIAQTKEELEAHKFKRIHIMGAGYRTDWKQIKRLEQVIVLSTIQSFSKLDPNLYAHFFDLTIVDEMHHVNMKRSQYGKVMEHNLSPRRYGLTATEPTKHKEYLVNEGFFGPIIAELGVEEGIEAGIIARPIIQLIPVPYEVEINQLCKNKYKNFYEHGIVNNEYRNTKIVDAALDSAAHDETTLIIIERTEHGQILKDMFKAHGFNVPFVFGATSPSRRLNVKKKLQSGQLKIAICSKIWREGINIPALHHIINAVGMKEEKLVIQALGRGLRRTQEKTTIKLTDFLDPYRILAEHSILRIQIYIKQGWL